MNRAINNSIDSLNGFLQENMRGDEQRYALQHDEQGGTEPVHTHGKE